MSKKRGKNRPPKIGLPARGAPKMIVRPCASCQKFTETKRIHSITDASHGQLDLCNDCHLAYARIRESSTYGL